MTWLPVPDFPDYRVSTEGLVRRGGRLIKATTNPNGYTKVCLYRGSRSSMKQIPLHSLVLIVFVGKRPQGKTAAHKNGIRSDNRLSNLYWATPKQQLVDKEKHGTYQRGEKVGNAVLTGALVKEFKTRYVPRCKINGAAALAREHGLNRHTVWMAIKGRQWGHICH